MYSSDDIKEIARVTYLKDKKQREVFGAIYNRCLKLYYKLMDERIKFANSIEQSFNRHHAKEVHFDLQSYYDAYYEFTKCYCQLSQFSFNSSLEEE